MPSAPVRAIFRAGKRDERMTPDLFYDPLHFTEEGARVFTNLLAEALIPYVTK
ncbi:MAG: hypothetical protein AB1846_15250 [Chloroflexota bacterium]